MTTNATDAPNRSSRSNEILAVDVGTATSCHGTLVWRARCGPASTVSRHRARAAHPRHHRTQATARTMSGGPRRRPRWSSMLHCDCQGPPHWVAHSATSGRPIVARHRLHVRVELIAHPDTRQPPPPRSRRRVGSRVRMSRRASEGCGGAFWPDQDNGARTAVAKAARMVPLGSGGRAS